MSARSARLIGWVLTAALAGCSSQKQPARQLMHDVESTFAAAASDGGKFAPEQVATVQAQVANLRSAFQRGDYDVVVTQGPEVLVQAQNLSATIAAAREATMTALNDQWTELAARVPEEMGAVRERIAAMDRPVTARHDQGRSWEGIDAGAARTSLAEAQSLWSKAQAAFATGNLNEAVKTARDVKTRVEAVAVQVNLELPAEAQAPSR